MGKDKNKDTKQDKKGQVVTDKPRNTEYEGKRTDTKDKNK